MNNRRAGVDARYVALRAIEAVRCGEDSEDALHRLFKNSALDSRDRALAYAITMAVLRNLIRLDSNIDTLVRGKKLDEPVRDALRIGIAQLLFMSKIPPHAAVSTAVELVRMSRKTSATGLVNAVMRRVIAEGAPELGPFENDIDRISVENSHPRWLIDRWATRHGIDFAESLSAANNREPRSTVRANSRNMTVEELEIFLREKGIVAKQIADFPEYLDLENRGNPAALPGFSDGLFSVQDPAFGLPVWLLSPKPHEKIAEIGCAPGGKIGHLAEIAGGDTELHGIDISAHRMAMVEDNLRRLGLQDDVELHIDDALSFDMPEYFDAILLDAPCTSLGVVRRHPEIRYRRHSEDIEGMAAIQRELIGAALRLLKPGGRLVYCSCSTEPEEGEEHLDLLPDNASPVRVATGIPDYLQDGSIVRTWPHIHDLDGMFCATIVKNG
ncbi:16S rRNA (cytosine(967)-C(5))-methyltransferase RsmB [bacterium]|nr:16S rRNA (cytosine(967)-C(5))-methyltransferase RsmB [bacterium]